jgi:hypothetical protein
VVQTLDRDDVFLHIIVIMTSGLHIFLLLGGILVTTCFADGGEPQRDVQYDTKHERNVLDFWPALKGGEPGPVVVWFHGGGFRDGDKSQLEKNRSSMLETYRKAGYAVVSCNHPILSDDELPKVEEGRTWLGLQLEFCQKHLPK